MLRKLLLIGVCFLLFSLPAAAQNESEWSVWMYNPDTLEFVRIFSGGTTYTFTVDLPFPATRVRKVYFTDDGNMLFICFADHEQTLQVAVYIVGVHERTHVIQVGKDMPCSLAYDDDSNRLAVMTHTAELLSNEWELDIFDLSTSQIVAILNSEQSQATSIGYFHYLSVQRWQRNSVTISGRLVGDGLYEQIFLWSLDNNSVTSVGENLYQEDYLPSTGETIRTDYNPLLTTAEIPSIGPGDNVVVLTDQFGKTYVVFHQPNSMVMERPWFINGGRHIAVTVSENFYDEHRVVLGRDGQGFALPMRAGQVHATQNGYVEIVSTDELTQIVSVEFIDGIPEARLVWERRNSGYLWYVGWMTPMQGETELPPFREYNFNQR